MPDSSPMLRTPLYEAHLRAGARMTGFGGWEMPVQYSSILEEHLAVRSKAGLFDISHMGEFIVFGAGAGAYLNRVLSSNVSKLQPGEGQYSFLLNEQGGVIDDLIVYRQEPETYLLVVNASKIAEDFSWMESHLPQEGVQFKDCSSDMGALALQGPQAAEILGGLLDPGEGQGIPRFGLKSCQWRGRRLWVARTGYTGEDGFEILCPVALVELIWETLLSLGVKPCGLGARDTLRLEACYPLNGQDLNGTTTPLEAGLGFAVDLEKSDFLGRSSLVAQKAIGVTRKLVALMVDPKSPPPRAHYPLFQGDAQVGEITSGSFSPTLQRGIALAYVQSSIATVGTSLEMEVRGRKIPIVIVKKPLYQSASL